LKDLGWKHFK